jgi:RNA polymerase sigma factor (sigma-70 family)
MVELTERHLQLPYALAAGFAPRGTNEYDELVSLGNEALVKAAHSYDPTKGVRPITHLYNCVRFQLISYSQRAWPAKNRRADGTERPVFRHEHRWAVLESLDVPPARGDRELTLAMLVPDPYGGVGDELEQDEVIDRVLRTLTPTERAAFTLRHAWGLTLRQIAPRLRVAAAATVRRLLRSAEIKARRAAARLGERRPVPPPGRPPAHDESIKDAARAGTRNYWRAQKALGKVPARRGIYYAACDESKMLLGPCRSLKALLRLAGAPTVQTRGRLGSSTRRAAGSLAAVGLRLVYGGAARRLAEYEGYVLQERSSR